MGPIQVRSAERLSFKADERTTESNELVEHPFKREGLER
jgi:hypothetical protein